MTSPASPPPGSTSRPTPLNLNTSTFTSTNPGRTPFNTPTSPLSPTTPFNTSESHFLSITPTSPLLTRPAKPTPISSPLRSAPLTNPPTNPSTLSTSFRTYLHRHPHLTFTIPPAPSPICIACDTPGPTQRCTRCPLSLCNLCAATITNRTHRGSLHRLISTRGRWKLGYSKGFLERERREVERWGDARWVRGEEYAMSCLRFEVPDYDVPGWIVGEGWEDGWSSGESCGGCGGAGDDTESESDGEGMLVDVRTEVEVEVKVVVEETVEELVEGEKVAAYVATKIEAKDKMAGFDLADGAEGGVGDVKMGGTEE